MGVFKLRSDLNIGKVEDKWVPWLVGDMKTDLQGLTQYTKTIFHYLKNSWQIYQINSTKLCYDSFNIDCIGQR